MSLPNYVQTGRHCRDYNPQIHLQTGKYFSLSDGDGGTTYHELYYSTFSESSLYFINGELKLYGRDELAKEIFHYDDEKYEQFQKYARANPRTEPFGMGTR